MNRHDTVGMSRIHRMALAAKLAANGQNQTIPTPNPSDPNTEVGGNIYPVAIFWVFVDIGTPAQQFPVALDTGSFTMDVPMVGCSTCPQEPPNNFYDVSKSSTGSSCPDGQCTFSNSYQTCDLSDPQAVCTISGNFYQDVASIAGLPTVQIVFGGVNYQTANFDQFKYIAGVVGLAPSGGNQDVFGTIFASGSIDANTYSMCFHQGSKSNGTFTLGGDDPQLYHGSIAWVENGGGFGGYNLDISDLLIADQSVGSTFQDSSAILDSGTNVLLVTSEQFQAIKSVFLANCTNNPLLGICSGLVANDTTLFDGTCYALTEAQIAAFPDLHFNLGSVTVTMHPHDYLLYRFYATEKCWGILDTGSEEEGGLFIVGDTLLDNYYTVFDNTANRIGWAEVNQKTCGSI